MGHQGGGGGGGASYCIQFQHLFPMDIISKLEVSEQVNSKLHQNIQQKEL